jgi:hypothetical protein
MGAFTHFNENAGEEAAEELKELLSYRIPDIQKLRKVFNVIWVIFYRGPLKLVGNTKY